MLNLFTVRNRSPVYLLAKQIFGTFQEAVTLLKIQFGHVSLSQLSCLSNRLYFALEIRSTVKLSYAFRDARRSHPSKHVLQGTYRGLVLHTGDIYWLMITLTEMRVESSLSFFACFTVQLPWMPFSTLPRTKTGPSILAF